MKALCKMAGNITIVAAQARRAAIICERIFRRSTDGSMDAMGSYWTQHLLRQRLC